MPGTALGRPVEILLVEDNPGDVILAREAFRRNKLDTRITEARNGAIAMDMLHNRGGYAETRRPDIVILDLNLPKKHGHEVLTEIKSDPGMDGYELCRRIKSDPELRRIPVVILTTSREKTDIVKTYDQYANCYISKPIDMETFVTVIGSMKEFWLGVVELPGG